ncbi:MAG: hypothetical protein IT319_09150 [Anaerolineae bacterium]|nr:hypothetical protein [Anaerolineae bacterium]
MDTQRRSIRLRDYDYASEGMYFITLCAHQRECLFGTVDDSGNVQLNTFGAIVQEEWLKTPSIRAEIELDEFVVMPNHFHGIVAIVDVGAHGRAPLQTPALYRPPRSLGALVAGFKSAVTKRINDQRGMSCARVWQRNYYEHVIRNESSLNDIRSYIQTNPACWAEDDENPANWVREVRQ